MTASYITEHNHQKRTFSAPSVMIGAQESKLDMREDSLSKTVSIELNGEPATLVLAVSTLAGLLDILNLHPKTIIIEHNGELIAPGFYATRELKCGDRIELIHFMGGGL
ncbi:sulfur carrier protein ThiS [bacterium]|nr:sulfur carrier protein ThiS [bacterium]